MPTKPVSTFTFATDSTFSSSPASGNPTKVAPASLAQGFIPEQGVTAEEHNYLLNIIGQWLDDWLLYGSSAGAQDAHLVETDSAGRTALVGLTLDNSGGTPTKGALQMVPQTAPSAANEGDLWTLAGSSGTSRTKLRYQDADGQLGGGGAGPQTIWATPNGHGANVAYDALTTAPDSTFVEVMSVTLRAGVTQPDLPAGRYLVLYSAQVTSNVSHGAIITFLQDAEALNTVVYSHEVPSGATQHSAFCLRTVDISSSADTILRMGLQALGTGNVSASESRIVVLGALDV